jgi:hypothetical protein
VPGRDLVRDVPVDVERVEAGVLGRRHAQHAQVVLARERPPEGDAVGDHEGVVMFSE